MKVECFPWQAWWPEYRQGFLFFEKPENISTTKEYITNSIWEMINKTELVVCFIDKNAWEWLGNSGLHNIQTNSPEIWIRLKAWVHGKWYAQEWLIALINWAKDNLDYDYIIYPVDENNLPSRKLAEKLWGQLQGWVTAMRVPNSSRILNIVNYRIYK